MKDNRYCTSCGHHHDWHKIGENTICWHSYCSCKKYVERIQEADEDE
jgi:hypothetical protein